MFNAIQTAQVIFIVKTSLDIFRPSHEYVWTCSVSGDCICEMKKVTESGHQGIKNLRSFLLYFDPW